MNGYLGIYQSKQSPSPKYGSYTPHESLQISQIDDDKYFENCNNHLAESNLSNAACSFHHFLTTLAQQSKEHNLHFRNQQQYKDFI